MPSPTLFVHSDDCVFPDHVRRIAERMGSHARLEWMPNGGQIDFYDRPELVDPAIAAIDDHLRPRLGG